MEKASVILIRISFNGGLTVFATWDKALLTPYPISITKPLIVKTSGKMDLIELMKNKLPQKYGEKLHDILTVRDEENIWKIFVKGENLLSKSLSLLDEVRGIMEVKVGY